MNALLIVVGILVALVFVGWLGLQVKPKPFPVYPVASPQTVNTVPLPEGLPVPVEGFYSKLYGDRVPVIESAVLTGRATIRPFARIPFPARYRFTHVAGRAYRHYIEACWFGMPFLKVNERFVDGKSLLEIPIIGTDEGPKVEQAANQGMWAESWQFPAVFVTDPRVHWLPIDDETAILEVPFKNEGHQRFVVRFDSETGLPTWTETMRWQRSDSTERVLWMTNALAYEELDGQLINTIGSATWMDSGRPWAVFELERAQFNVDVDSYVRAQGL